MQSVVTAAALRRALVRGFTLIELMIVLLIVAILVAVGLPSMTDFVADERVRTVTSDIMSEIGFARATAVVQSRRGTVRASGHQSD